MSHGTVRRFTYPVRLTPDRRDGGYVVTFPDVPEAITQGDSVEESLANATDALEEAVAARIRLREDIPLASRADPGQRSVVLPIETATKAALHIAIRESGLTNTALAARLRCDEKEVRRLLDPYHPSKLPRIERALHALGRQLLVSCVSGSGLYAQRR
jgi:antitoxin HicB